MQEAIVYLASGLVLLAVWKWRWFLERFVLDDPARAWIRVKLEHSGRVKTVRGKRTHLTDDGSVYAYRWPGVSGGVAEVSVPPTYPNEFERGRLNVYCKEGNARACAGPSWDGVAFVAAVQVSAVTRSRIVERAISTISFGQVLGSRQMVILLVVGAAAVGIFYYLNQQGVIGGI